LKISEKTDFFEVKVGGLKSALILNNERVQNRLRLLSGVLMLRLGSLSVCDTDGLVGQTGKSGAKDGGSEVRAVTPRFNLSGQVYQAAGVALDSDINDNSQGCISNNDLENAQKLTQVSYVQGFASKVPTNGSE